MAMEEVQREVGLASKALLGSQTRLQVAAAVADHETGLVYGRNLARALNLDANEVRRDLRKFAEGGVVRAVGQIGGNQPFYFERLDSAFWTLAKGLLAEVKARGSTVPSSSAGST